MTNENNNIPTSQTTPIKSVSNAKPSKNQLHQMLASSAIALFWVIFLWNFWQQGVYALGVNAFIFLLSIFILFNWQTLKERKFFKRDNIICQLPIFLIILSFLIYENPFTKTASLFFLPILFAVFYNYINLDDNTSRYWGFNFLNHLTARISSFLKFIGRAIRSYLQVLSPKSESRKNITKILIGVLIFLAVAVAVIIPLLSSADKEFANKIDFFYTWITDLISLRFVMKLIIFGFISTFLLATLKAWQRPFNFEAKESSGKQLDAIISGIVLGGVLALYLLFLWVQIERLFTGTLPIDFKTTESLVKSGFWQLIFLSLINIGFFAVYYQKTNSKIQKVLSIFSLASLFLVFSATQRMALYVVYYGFSYEKFFALYTVIFCIIIFTWLIIKLFKKVKMDIVKFILFLFLWMYGLISIFPIEQFIFRANTKLAQAENSRIDLYEMTMLSSDVFGLVKKNNLEWYDWLDRQVRKTFDKKWYEMNLINLLNLKDVSFKKFSQPEIDEIKKIIYRRLSDEYHILITGETDGYDVSDKKICGENIGAEDYKNDLVDKFNLAVKADFRREFISLEFLRMKPIRYDEITTVVNVRELLKMKTILPSLDAGKTPITETARNHKFILSKKNSQWRIEKDIAPKDFHCDVSPRVNKLLPTVPGDVEKLN